MAHPRSVEVDHVQELGPVVLVLFSAHLDISPLQEQWWKTLRQSEDHKHSLLKYSRRGTSTLSSPAARCET